MKKLSYWAYQLIRALVRLVYPKPALEGLENLPDGPCVIVGNHAQMNGPIVAELYIPGKRAIWCQAEMMRLREVPAYAYRDFWSLKPRWCRWFYRILSYLIAPLSVCVFNNAQCVGVYRDMRLLATMRQSIGLLRDGAKIIIFPEHAVPHNQIVYEFQDRFIDLARMFYRQTGQRLAFVPMYIAPALRKACFGGAILFDPQAQPDEERARICSSLMDGVTQLALALPRHRVVPYLNLPRKDYPYSVPQQ